ncbi:MAG: PD40 domain-containing protein, partial [Pirellulaceae bacterium]|nr:PD40 domain-containing protein [Pirellulaceae bacterium]
MHLLLGRIVFGWVLLANWCCWSMPGQAAEPIVVQMANDPTLSPDGKTLVFVWGNDLWSVPIAGGQATRLTTDPARDAQPRFSPDGQQLAFVSDRTGAEQIYVMPAQGGLPIQKTFHSEGYTLVGWFPDGESLLALGQRDHFWRAAQRMLRINLKQPTVEKVLLDDTATHAAISPDGKKVLFVREGERWWRKGYRGQRAGQIWLLDLTDGSTTELLHEGYECLWPLWMPDGSGFYFTKGDPQGFDLWRYRFAKKADKPGKQKKLSGFDEDSIVQPTLSKDGSTLVFRHLFDLYAYAPDDGQAAPRKIAITVAADVGARDDRLPATHTRADNVAFTDDGLEIAFTAGGDLWVMDSELREPIQVTKTDGQESDPLFATDGRSLFFTRATDGQVDLWMATPKSTELFWWQQQKFVETQLTQSADSESNLQLSPDGKQLFYQKGRCDLAVLDLATKESKLLVDGFSSVGYS